MVLRYDAAARKSYLLVLEGTPASTPTAPAISRTNLLYDLCLAQITRPAGSTAITAGNITDTRLDESLCGVMSDGVTRIPTDQLLKAAQARINALEETATNSASAAAASQRAAAASQSAAANSANAASRSQSAAANSASAAASSQRAAAGSQSAAASSASSASGSASAAASSQKAAASSQSAAAASEAAAKKAAAEAGTKAGTDKTLSMDSAPADAKASGDMLAWLHNMLITGEVQYHVTLTDGSLLCASDGAALLATRKIQFA